MGLKQKLKDLDVVLGTFENPNPQKEGAVVRRQSGRVFPLITADGVQNPRRYTLNTEQFSWPSSFLVVDAKVKDVFKEDDVTGFAKRDSSDKKIPYRISDEVGNEIQVRYTKLQLVDADAVLEGLKTGRSYDSLPRISCEVRKELPLQLVEPGDALIKLVSPNVLFDGGFGNFDNYQLKIVCDDVEPVDFDGEVK